MVKLNYRFGINKKEKKYTHLNYTERTQIERWYNRDHRTKVEIAELLDRVETCNFVSKKAK